MHKIYSEQDLIKEAIVSGNDGHIFAAYHITTETDDFKSIKPSMGWTWEKHNVFDYIYLFNGENELNEFLRLQKSVVRYLPYSDKETYSIEEFIGAELEVHYDEEVDEEYVSLVKECGNSRLEIEVWDSYEDYLNGCKRFDNGKDAEDAADKMQENGKYDVTVNF